MRARKGGNMRRSARFWGLGAVVALGAALMLGTTFASAASSGGAQHVRWDIVSTTGIPPTSLNAGGFAEAKTPPLESATIKLTGSGTFVAPAGSNGGSGAVTGGGTWQTRNSANVVTGSGTYTVEELVRWEFDNFQTDVGFTDTIDHGRRANGNAVLRIAFSDGSQGVLTVGCHGPGADAGIFE